MRFLRLFLAPFSLIFLVITELRNFLYNIKVFRSSKFDIPVISVGNLSVGGTGKTPHIEYLVRLLKNNFRPATLSRGYGRKTKEYLLLTADESPESSGDEPLQFKKKFPDLPVAVDSNRVNGVMHLIGDHPETEVVLLDDAFQHRAIQPGLNILLTEYANPFFLDFILPVGNLREMRKNASRADVVIITKSIPDIPGENEEFIIQSVRRYTYAEIFFSSIKYGSLKNNDHSITREELINKSVLLVTGIANPRSLANHLRPLVKQLDHLSFGDHHTFTENDIRKIVAKYNSFPGEKLLVTTEKDAMRLLHSANEKSRIPENIPVYIQEIKVAIREKEKFESRIINYVREHSKKR